MWKCKENCQRRDDNSKHGCDDNKQLIDCLIYELEQANAKLTESHIANVMSSRLRREIEKVKNLPCRDAEDIKQCEYIVKLLQSAISCEEISETYGIKK